MMFKKRLWELRGPGLRHGPPPTTPPRLSSIGAGGKLKEEAPEVPRIGVAYMSPPSGSWSARVNTQDALCTNDVLVNNLGRLAARGGSRSILRLASLGQRGDR